MIIPHLAEPRYWVAHLARVTSEDIQCWLDAGDALGDASRWTVTSATVPGLLYTVRYQADGNGQQAACDCEAGKHDRPCKHLTVVLLTLGVLDPDEIAAEGARISRERDHERAIVLAERKAIRDAAREAKRMVATG